MVDATDSNRASDVIIVLDSRVGLVRFRKQM